MSEFTAKIKAMLDDGSLKSQFQKIENQKIDLKNVTVSKIELSSSALSALEKQLSNLKADVKFTFNGGKGGDVGKQISQQINSAMSSADKLKIGLDNRKFEADLGKINQGFVGLTTRSQALQKNVVDLNNAFKLMSNTNEGMDTRLHAFEMYQSLIPGVTSQISQLAAEEKKLAETAKLSSAKDSFLSKIDEQIRKLTPETEKFRQEFDKIKNEVGHVYDSNGLSKLEADFKKLTNTIKEEEAAVKAAAREQQTLTKSSTLSNNIEAWMNKNKAAAEKFGDELRELQTQLRGNVNAGKYTDLSNKFREIKSQASAAGLTMKSFASSMKVAILQVAGLSGAMMIMQKGIQGIKSMFNEVLNVDTALTELYRITDLSDAQYKDLFEKSKQSAMDYGATLDDMVNATADWTRLGFDPMKESGRLAEITAMYQHVTDLDHDTATENLVTAYKGYQDQLMELTGGDATKGVELAADIFDRLGNEFAVSAADVGEGMKRSASALQLAGNSIQENAAMVTG